MSTPSSFWTEHNDDMHDPAYALAFARESQRVAAVDRIMNQLDAVRIAKGIPKTQLARVVGTGEAALRRLFSRRATANPTIATLEAVANELGYRVTLEPIPPTDTTARSVTKRPVGAH